MSDDPTTGHATSEGAGGSRPGIVVAAPQSGSGKTTVTLAVIAALRARGLVVQPFKVGPDFIDPSHLTAAAGRRARNLDAWLTTPGYVTRLAADATRDADLAVVEGMMGLFDGVDGASDRGSTAEIAALLGWPVLLVVDASAAARSVAAVVRGFRTFAAGVEVAAVVFDRVGGTGHLRMLEDACAGEGVVVLGGLPATETLDIPERHLGLHVAGEAGGPHGYDAFARAAVEHLDLDALLRLVRERAPRARVAAGAARAAEAAETPPVRPLVTARPRCRIAVARDAAFCFYYEDNLELLRAAGAEIVEWSPLAASRLPADVDGLYLGGGYPELHARTLGAASVLADDVRRFAARGGMIYAECGGFMYLQRAIRLLDGSEAEMAGVLPGIVAMRPRLVAIGYRERAVTLDGRCLTVRGQEFRYSRLVEWPERATVDGEEVRLLAPPEAEAPSGAEGFAWRRVVAGYVHLHFGSAPGFAELLVARAVAARGSLA
ncbi:MAG: cobyrinate a,c-diamide synthase [Thermodesulfobacteriota bacterium]